MKSRYSLFTAVPQGLKDIPLTKQHFWKTFPVAKLNEKHHKTSQQQHTKYKLAPNNKMHYKD